MFASFPGSPPLPRTRLIGRAVERAQASAFLLAESVPLLTLTGPGGVGKTRLALAIANDVAPSFADGVIWVDLAPLTDPALIPTTIATTLGTLLATEIAPVEALAQALRPRQALLLLDNCEHLLADVAEVVARLLARGPALQVLATSRAPLQLRGEQRLPIEPLTLPSAVAPFKAIIQTEAVRLFQERAQAVRPSFALSEANASSVAALCRQLDGLPLAIELAAARSGMLSPQALLAQMHDRLLLFPGMRDAPLRQQTMEATIAWSYALLDAPSQALLRTLAVFASGFSLEAVVAVAPPEEATSDGLALLEGLVAQSLVRQLEEEEEPRFTLLETIRAFAQTHLEAAGEAHSAQARHAAFFVRTCLAAAASWPLAGPPKADLDWVEQEHPNIRASLEHLITQGATETALKLAVAIGDFWFTRNYCAEGITWYRRALAGSGLVEVRTRALALTWITALAGRVHDTTALAAGEESVAILAALDDDTIDRANAVLQLGVMVHLIGDYPRADTLLAEAAERFQALGDTAVGSVVLANRAMIVWLIGNHDLAMQHAEAALAIQQDQEHPWCLMLALMIHGDLSRHRGNRGLALADYQHALSLAISYGDTALVSDVLVRLGLIAMNDGNASQAARLFGAATALRERVGYPPVEYIQEEYDRALVIIQHALDPETLHQSWAAGRHLTATDLPAEVAQMETPDAIPASLVNHADSLMAHQGATTRPHSPCAPFRLTNREQDVLVLLCRRLTDAEIAAQLFISPYTASKHVSNVLGKLGATNRREAAAIAARDGLL